MTYWIHYINSKGKIDKMPLEVYELYTESNSDLFKDIKAKIIKVLFIDDIPETDDIIMKICLKIHDVESELLIENKSKSKSGK